MRHVHGDSSQLTTLHSNHCGEVGEAFFGFGKIFSQMQKRGKSEKGFGEVFLRSSLKLREKETNKTLRHVINESYIEIQIIVCLSLGSE